MSKIEINPKDLNTNVSQIISFMHENKFSCVWLDHMRDPWLLLVDELGFNLMIIKHPDWLK